MKPLSLKYLYLAALLTLTTARGEETFRLVSYNIHHGEGTDGKLDLARIAGFLKAQQPDVVALQEVDRKCQRTGKVDQAAELAALTGMTATFQKAMDYGGGEYGLCLLTKNPPLATGGFPLPPAGEPRAGQWVKVAALGGTLTVANTHLDVSTGPARLTEARVLSLALKDLPGTVLLAGDFNAVRGDGVMSLFASHGWALPLKQGNPATVPSVTPMREIDFALIHPAAALRVVTHRVLEESLFSDHRAVLVEVTLPAP